MSTAGVAFYESCPATIVEHCCAADLTGRGGTSGARDLIVARSTSLELYALHEEPAPYTPPGAPPAKGALDGITSAQLRFVTRLPLNGVVASMQPVSAAGGGSAGRDRLLLSFADAKVALLDFDAEAHALRTLAAHSFEELGALVGCYESKLVPPLLRVH